MPQNVIGNIRNHLGLFSLSLYVSLYMYILTLMYEYMYIFIHMCTYKIFVYISVHYRIQGHE